MIGSVITWMTDVSARHERSRGCFFQLRSTRLFPKPIYFFFQGWAIIRNLSAT